jgi:hypothetical protein
MYKSFCGATGADQVMGFIEDIMQPTCPRPYLLVTAQRRARRPSRGAAGQAISGIVRRSRSIQIDSDQLPGGCFKKIWKLVFVYLL